jgi:hypothetical protein
MGRIVDHLTRFKKGFSNSRLAPTLTLVAVVLLASWMGGLRGGYYASEWTLVAVILAGLLVLASATGLLRASKVRWSTIALGLFAAYTAWTFASLLWSPNQGDAWLGAGQTLLYLLVIWVSISLIRLGASRRWVLAASVIGPTTVAVLTLLHLTPRLEDYFENTRLVGTVGYYNGEAAFLLLPFWVAMYLAGSPSINPVFRAATLAGITLNLELAVLTQSRGAMVAIAASIPIFFLLSVQRLRGLLALIPVVVSLVVAFPVLNGVYIVFLN